MRPSVAPWLCATRLHNRTHFHLDVPLWPSPSLYSNRPREDVASESASNSHEWPSSNRLSAAIRGNASPSIHQTTSDSLASNTVPIALRTNIDLTQQSADRFLVLLIVPRTRFRRSSREQRQLGVD